MSGDASPLHGIIPPLVTPLRPDGEVDVVSLRRLAAFLLESGVDGLFVLGSSGEAPFLTEDQRATVIGTVVDAAAGRAPVLAGVIDTTAPRVAPRAAEAVKLGADYVVTPAPFFALTNDTETASHFREVSEAAGAPVVIYQIPARAGQRVGNRVVTELARDGVVAALKDSSPDFSQFRRLTLDTADIDGFGTFTGAEALVDSAVLAGASGAMPGMANIDPAGFVRVCNAASAGDVAAARAEQERLLDLFALIEDPLLAGFGPDAGAVSVFKIALLLRGVIETPRIASRPLAAQPELTDMVRKTLRKSGLI